MKKHPFILLCIAILIIGSAAALYVATKERTGDAQTLFALIDSEIDREANEAASNTPTAPATPPPAFARVNSSTTVQGEGFTIDVPTDWVLFAPNSANRLGDGRRDLGIVQNKPSEDMGATEGIVTINIYDVAETSDLSYEKIVKGYGWDDEDVAHIVAFMKDEASDIFPDYSAADVKTETTQVDIDGEQATKTSLTCLKPCYIEGGAETMAYYFVDDQERVYLLFASTGTGDQATDLLAQAEAVIKTFKRE